MNKKRALEVLEMFLDKQCSLERTLNHMDTTDVEIWDAVYTARNALSAEPCEDAISRAAAIKAMDDLEQEDIERYSCSIPEGFDGKRAIEALQKLPSVTPTCSGKPNNCTACILDGTDACSRGAGRAVDGRVCDDFVGESEDAE